MSLEFKFGDIVIVDFPYTNQVQSKLRPSLVLLDTKDSDLLIARITSKRTSSEHDIELIEWEKAGLSLPSFIRIHKIVSIDKALAKLKLGSLQAVDKDNIRLGFKELTGLFM
jgi:mRNA interferase MazF